LSTNIAGHDSVTARKRVVHSIIITYVKDAPTCNVWINIGQLNSYSSFAGLEVVTQKISAGFENSTREYYKSKVTRALCGVITLGAGSSCDVTPRSDGYWARMDSLMREDLANEVIRNDDVSFKFHKMRTITLNKGTRNLQA